MKTGLTTLAAILTLAASPVFADPIFGTWQTIPDDNGNYGHIELSACGSLICGVLVRSFDATDAEIASDITGRRIIWDMEARGDGKYAGGKVWSPDRDKTYNSRLDLNQDALTVSGCVLGMCRDGGTWSRVN